MGALSHDWRARLKRGRFHRRAFDVRCAMLTHAAAPAAPVKTNANTWSPTVREVQRKLMVGPAGDRFEQEADRVADAVLAGGDAPAIARRGPSAQRPPAP